MRIADLPADELRKINAYWRAANYLSVGQIYLYDNEGAHRIDPTGEEHGVLGRFVRWLDKAGDMEPKHLKRHEQEMLAGHCGIGVSAKEPEAREKVRAILKSHNKHFINFYGEWAIEGMES